MFNLNFCFNCRYELSQDLLEKQIELLERKYGGVRARNAAITIQRAFRHYMMVKKFASITAMAKAEKRSGRRTVLVGAKDETTISAPITKTTDSDNATEPQLDVTASIMSAKTQQQQQQQQPRVTILAGPAGANNHQSMSGTRTPPTRSMSMRERRNADDSLPRSQSGKE